MKIVYNTTITTIGGLVPAFYEEKLMILFKENAPEELAEYCVLHDKNEVLDIVKEGDILVIADEEYTIVYVGDEVQKNLEDLGHISLRFDGGREGLGGSLYLENKALPTIKKGDRISIYRN
jgi:PTS system glucitol/sorbitol-specific IIA component